MKPSDEAYQRLLDQLWQDREQPAPIDWIALWREVCELCCTISYQDPIHDQLMERLRDCTRAYHFRDAVVFQNSLTLMRRLRKELPDAP